MSHMATHWAMQLSGTLPSIEWKILMLLADCHNPSHGCFPSQKYLADNANIARSSVNRSLNSLEVKGLIKRVQRYCVETQSKRSTRYVLAIEKDQDDYDLADEIPMSQDRTYHVPQSDNPCPRIGQPHVPGSDINYVNNNQVIEPKKETNKLVSKKVGSRLPSEFEIPDEWLNWALSKGWEHSAALEEAEKFKDYWISKSGQNATKLDWFATWRNWLRNNQQHKIHNQNRKNGGSSNDQLSYTEQLQSLGYLDSGTD